MMLGGTEMAIANVTGNQAVARAALDAGAKLICGYPGTPSSEVVDGLWHKDIPGVTVQWSVNEKVAFEQAGACAWAGQRAMVTMKMSGMNVAYDSMISMVYSGCTGGFVIYVCDDPGVSAGMPEQDVRGFAMMSDIPVLEPASVLESYRYILYAFELSEAIGGPVMVRSVTSVSQVHALVELPEAKPFAPREPKLIHDITKYTKAGAKICMDQHADLLARLEAAKAKLAADRFYALTGSGGNAIVSVGAMNSYVEEALEILGKNKADFTVLKLAGSLPIPDEAVSAVLGCEKITVLEENEPYVEKALVQAAYFAGRKIAFSGKLVAPLSRIGSYTAATCAKAIAHMLGESFELDLSFADAAGKAACGRPIGVCAGCPHRGVFMSLNNAVRKLGYKKEDVLIAGDIGCTILGMSPPFNTLWTEVAMGASIAVASGYYYAGVKTPVIATLGDSTFQHAGMPPLLNCVQNDIPITVVVMDNGWTSRTGMQVNANTDKAFQQNDTKVRVDIVEIIKGLGVKQLWVADPYDVPGMTATLMEAIQKPGVKVIVSRRECAIQAGRRKIRYGTVSIDQDKCIRCKACIERTGCSGLDWDGERVSIVKSQCIGCGVCMSVCPKQAIVKED